ncbi:hypothetical protein Tco_0238197 [Tanacetum coccineum]
MGTDPMIRLRRESNLRKSLVVAGDAVHRFLDYKYREPSLKCVASETFDISEDLHPKLPGPEERIVDFPEGEVGVYTKFFEFANFRLPISQYLFDILGHYQIHLSQLLVIGVAKDEMLVRGSYSAEDVAVLNTRRTPIQKQPEALKPRDELSTMDHPRGILRGTNEGPDELSQETPTEEVGKLPQSTRGGKSLAAMGLEKDSTFNSAAQETPAYVSDPEPLYTNKVNVPPTVIAGLPRVMTTADLLCGVEMWLLQTVLRLVFCEGPVSEVKEIYVLFLS